MKSLFDVRKKGNSMLNNVCTTEFDPIQFLCIDKGMPAISSLPNNLYSLNKPVGLQLDFLQEIKLYDNFKKTI